MSAPELKEWTRETSWRQGHVLPTAAVESLAWLNETDAEATCVVVISHDCDLANDNAEVEPDVEFVVGRVVTNANGNFTWGKAPRTLHYSAMRDGAPVVIELVSTDKGEIDKASLAQFEPDTNFHLDAKGLAVLRSWLASRYNRTAFPDKFVSRMKATKADSKLAKQLESHGALISFVYFDLDAGENVERAAGDPYTLSVVLVFNPGDDPDVAAEEADSVAEALEIAIRARLSDPNVIALKSCFALSEDDLPVSRARVLSLWRLEHMTLKSDEDQPGAVV